MSRNDDDSFVYEDLDDVQGNILFASVDYLYNTWIPIITQSKQQYNEEYRMIISKWKLYLLNCESG